MTASQNLTSGPHPVTRGRGREPASGHRGTIRPRSGRGLRHPRGASGNPEDAGCRMVRGIPGKQQASRGARTEPGHGAG